MKNGNKITPYNLNVRKIARNKGVKVVESDFPTDQRGFLAKGKNGWVISVNRNDTPERKVFTIAHELGELEYMNDSDMDLDQKHEKANRFAGKLLLPEDVFIQDVWNYNLSELKQKFGYVSYEVIARRSLEFRNRILTIFDNNKKTLRKGSRNYNYPARLTAVEIDLIRKCYDLRTHVSEKDELLLVEAYYVDEGRCVKRVLLLTELVKENGFI